MLVFFQGKNKLKNWFPAFWSHNSISCLHLTESQCFFNISIFRPPYSINENCKIEKLADALSFITAPLQGGADDTTSCASSVFSRTGLVIVVIPKSRTSSRAVGKMENSVRDRTVSRPAFSPHSRPCGFPAPLFYKGHQVPK